MMPEGLSRFIERERVCVLSVQLSDDRGVHIAPMVYWCHLPTLQFYMSTSTTSEKLEWWRAQEPSTHAGISVGNQKKMPYLIQLRGMLEVVDYSKIDETILGHYMSIADVRDNPKLSKNTMIRFTPIWIRYSDWLSGEKHRIDL